MWMEGEDWQCLALRGVPLEIRLGVYDSERVKPQRISVDIELWRHRPIVPPAGIEDCLDYDRVYRWMADTWPQRAHVELLETLAEELAAKCLEDSRVAACQVRLRKLDAYDGAGWPEITLRRTRKAGQSR
jgi:dihydroneopterin aldolase